MKPLSLLTYYIRNKAKVIPILAILTLSVLGISVTAAVSGSMFREINSLYGNFYVNYYEVSIGFSADSEYESTDEYFEEVDRIRKNLEENEYVDYILEPKFARTKVQTMFGSEGATVVYLEEDDIDTFMDEMKVSLVKGRLPEKNDELVLGEGVMKNKKLEVGDYLGSDVDDEEWIEGKNKVVGIIAADSGKLDESKFGIGTFKPNGQQEFRTFFLAHPVEGKEEELHNYLMNLDDDVEDLWVETEQTVEESIDEEFKSINTLLWAINIVVVLTITSSVALLQVIFFMQRANEFGLLASIGYSKGFIIKRTLLEATVNILLGWALGIVFSEAVYKILNAEIFTPKGMAGLTILELNTFLFTIPVPIAVIVFSVGTVLRKLIKMDPVAIIERRD